MGDNDRTKDSSNRSKNTNRVDKEKELFLTELRQNPYLEKEEAYYQLNLELQKKTSEIFKKIENYTKSRSAKFTAIDESGDYFSDSDSENDKASKCTSKSSRYFRSEERLHTAKSLHAVSNSRNETNELPPVSSRSKSFSISESMQMFSSPSDVKNHQSRIQRATESVIKCLQSKLVNYESRLTDLHLQFRQKIQENTMLESKVKALEEERERLLRNTATLQTSVEKHSKVADLSKNNLTIKNNTIASMKREIDDLKREQRQSSGQIQSLQTRLHRSNEENERLKIQNKSAQLHLKEVQSEGRTKLDELNQRVVQLEQQKSSFSATISKQNQIIKNFRDHKK